MSNSVLSPEQLVQQLQWRYATKQFDSTRTIPEPIWDALEKSLVLTPSSFGLQPWKFFVVHNPQTRQQLLEYSWGQTQVVDASHLVVLAIKKSVNADDVDRFMQRTVEVRQVELESLTGYANIIKKFLEQPQNSSFDVDDWAARQVYIALGQFMTSAAFLGIDTCPMEGFIPAKYDEVLGLTATDYTSVVVCPAGYRQTADKHAQLPKVRFKQADVIERID
ncbi:NAD(P)H-dependent oxidoreductase [Acaryochloris sp. IP29b_bin.148]|uniref:NAD(P)H-dependent oxidoreductase n=1 Tax=Acaryochloris sp. IP29b_bin.148 TaxID=2969218 RepID=UPI00260FDE11|nr:NAD(P)H-dependent oxidoreductase [Acaryochloris sp. IP29b_bin.148]